MNNPSNSVINSAVKNLLKRCLEIGSNTVVVIDKSIVQKLRLNEKDTYLEQELTTDGILMRIRRFE